MFTPLAKLTDLYDGFKKVVVVNSRSYLLIQAEQQLYLIENRCPHMDAPLATGELRGNVLRCRAHGIGFSLVTGLAEGPMAGTLDCLAYLPLIYEGDQVGAEV